MTGGPEPDPATLTEGPQRQTRRILMTLDAVGGVWQYAISLAGELTRSSNEIVFAGLGPKPSPDQLAEAESIGSVVWLQTPPDWLARGAHELAGMADELKAVAGEHEIDLVHLNAPTQAASLTLPCPIVAVSHSCVVTWFHTVRGRVPEDDDWSWHKPCNQAGFDSADVIVAPSASHAASLATSYGTLPELRIVHNAVVPSTVAANREDIISAAGRWWDDGKNGKVLDEATARTTWPVFAAGPTQSQNAGMSFSHATALGSLPNAETRKLMAQSGIFVSPSIYEPFGLAALEAAHAETPLVLADIPTYRELWDEAALFFPPHDAAALADTLNALAAKPDLRKKLGSAAKQRAGRFTLARQAAAMEAVYEEATSIHAKRS